MSARLLIAAALVTLPAGCSFDTAGPTSGDDPVGPIGGDDPAAGDGSPVSGSPDGTAMAAPTSCADALKAGAVTRSGVIEIDPDGAGRFPVYCDMETDGGGWTLALKADGERSTFRYTSPLWTTDELLNADAPDRDHTEAKLDSFNRVPFHEVLIRFDTAAGTGGDYESRWVWMDLAADNLRSLFEPGEYVQVYLGRQRWLDAIPDATLQDHCNREGVNAGVEFNKVRIGIVGNDQLDCLTPESKLGVGSSYSCQSCGECAGLAGPAAGSNNEGCSIVVSFATLMVR
jgi:hypothetical protein